MAKNEAVIRANDSLATFINVFDVEPSKQQELVQVLNEAAEKVIRHRPGCISLSVLASKDGSRVINLAQWRSPEDIAATREDPKAAEYGKKIAQLAKANPSVYSVSSIFKPSASV